MLLWSNSGTCGARSLSQSGAPAPLCQLPPTNSRTSPRVNTSRTSSFTLSQNDALRNIRQSQGFASHARNNSVAVRAAYTGIGIMGGFPESVDPLHQAPGSTYTPGSTFSVHGPAELDEFVTRCSDQVVILMCKARACRPCKAFTRKYIHLAERFTSSVFLDVTGDENMETRSMMMKMEVKSTPTFMIYKNGQLVETTVGVNEVKIKAAIRRHLQPGEPGFDLNEQELKAQKEAEAAEAAEAAAA